MLTSIHPTIFLLPTPIRSTTTTFCASEGGVGGTDSLSFGTKSPNRQPPLFMDTQIKPLEISIKWGIFFIAYIIFYQIIVLKGFKNKFECIQLLLNVDVEY